MVGFVALLALAIGGLCGWWARAWCYAPTTEPSRRDPYPWDDYEKRRERLDRAYTESIKEYDRLVTWASGGALLLSITFVEKLAPEPDPETASVLGMGWTLLICAFVCSLFSQYSSSRVHSYRVRELEHMQKTAEDRDEAWAGEAHALAKVAGYWGKATKWSTALSGVLLACGLGALSLFAFQNTPFR